MAERRNVEVFTAGCPICDEAVSMVKSIACPSCEVVVHDLQKDSARAKELGITSVPTVAVDGKIVDCCERRPVNVLDLKRAGIGTPL